MRGTRPGCRLTAGSDRRSSTETGNAHYHWPVPSYRLTLLTLTFISFYLSSEQHQDHYVMLPRALDLLPRPGVRLVREPRSVSALERPQEAGAPGRRLRLLRHRKLKG